uniref:Leupaxin n=1 Tax=Oncorhynchus kisutch TaxID=8019 RepID=A0A8C7ISJ5_ONCKI
MDDLVNHRRLSLLRDRWIPDLVDGSHYQPNYVFLEELAFNSTGPESSQKKERDTANTYGPVPKVCSVGLHPRKGKEPDSTNVYSELAAPMEAGLLSPRSASRELESIMDELLLDLEMGLPDPSPSTPPPLVQKSVKKKQIGEKKEMDDTQVKDESTNSPKTSDLERKASTHGKTDTIDDLLGGLSSDMEKMGVHTMAKGHCASCGKVIVGKMITALGQVWHPEHFVCVVCTAELGTIGFFEREGKTYCEKDYQHLFSPRCSYCKGPILKNILTAMDCTWHPEHFICSHCGERFGPEGFLEKDGKPYCHRLLPSLCSKVLWLRRACERELPDCSQRHLASQLLRLLSLSEVLHRWLFPGAGWSSPVLSALPLPPGYTVWGLWRAHLWVLHLGYGAQVPP